MLRAVSNQGGGSSVEFKSSVQAATTAALANTPTYANGSSGVGATLTAGSNGALPAQDGITLIAGNRLLVKNQASALQNGIYVVTQVGTGGTPYILTRSSDFNSSSNITYGSTVPVDAGTTQSGTMWTLVGSGTITVGTTALNFANAAVIPGGSSGTLQYNAAGVFGGISGWTTDGTNTLTGASGTTVAIGGATIGPNALAVNGQVTNAGGTITTSQPFTITQTWNAAGVAFTGVVESITNTASAAGSLIHDWQIGGFSAVYINSNGSLYITSRHNNTNPRLGFATGATDATVSTYIEPQSSDQILFNTATGSRTAAISSTALQTGFITRSDYQFGWSATTDVRNAMDAMISRGGAATIQLGAADVSSGSAVAQTLKVQGSSTNSATPALFTISGSDNTGTGTNGGGLTMRAGNATGASGTRNGGDFTIQAGTGASAGGSIIFQTATTTSLTTKLTIAKDGSIIIPAAQTASLNFAVGGGNGSAIYGIASSNDMYLQSFAGPGTRLGMPADGVTTLSDVAGTSYGRLQFGGTTSSFPALKRSSAALITRLADDSADATHQVGQMIISGIASDATHTDSTVCQDTTTHQLYAGSGAVGICLGTSSARFKTDIAKFDDGLGAVLRLKPVTYRYKPGYGTSDRDLYGFLAEDVDEVLPKLVGPDKDGKPNSVDWAGMVPILVKAIQELESQVHDVPVLLQAIRDQQIMIDELQKNNNVH